MAIQGPNQPVTKLLDLEEIESLDGLSASEVSQIKEIVGTIAIEEINNFLDDSKSPVRDGRFKTKKADGERSILFEDGDMRDAIEFKSGSGSVIEIGVWDDEETPKAYNHNVGDTLPKRQFIPMENGSFKGKINKKIKDAIIEFKASGDIATKPDEFDEFIDIVGPLFRFSIRDILDG